MHPTVVSDKPGVCPVCAMELVRKGKPGEEVKITDELARLIKSTNEVVLSDIKTIRAEYKSMPLSWQLQGVVTYDTRNIQLLSSRMGGRLEKVYLKYNYQPVRKGQKVAEIYSTELVNAQREYLFLLAQDASNAMLIESARKKLVLLGVTQSQIDELNAKREVNYSFPIFSAYNGYVISEYSKAPEAPVNFSSPSSTASMGMGGYSMKPNNSIPGSSSISDEFIREGNYVAAGQTLFRLVNTDKLWVEFNVPASASSQIVKGTTLKWSNDDEPLQSAVDFIQPFFMEGEKFLKIRSYVTNHNLSIGQLVEATVQIDSKESLWVPQSALLSMGISHVLFVKERGVLIPKVVTTGAQSEGFMEIITGLTSGDEIALHASYLVDSENFIKTAN